MVISGTALCSCHLTDQHNIYITELTLCWHHHKETHTRIGTEPQKYFAEEMMMTDD